MHARGGDDMAAKKKAKKSPKKSAKKNAKKTTTKKKVSYMAKGFSAVTPAF
jgi:hypothetical protein